MMWRRSLRNVPGTMTAVGCCGAGLLVALTWIAAVAADKSPAVEANKKFPPEQLQFFEKEVLPILKAECFKCHGAEEKIRGGLKLTSREEILKGGDLGPAVSLQKPEESLLLEAIQYKLPEAKMPPKGKLPAPQLEVLTKWVKLGLPWNAELVKIEPKVAAEPIKVDPKRGQDYWAYQPVKQPAVPTVKNGAWVKNPIDAFILSKLEANNLAPTAPATKVSLVRRAYYDLTGLPPTPEEVDAFVADPSPQAYEKLLDRLLASPHYGEKWGRHWLDLVRYAETNGYERDSAKPFAWRYRDYVIGAFQQDKPYDQFLKEQLAGDELDEVTAESLIATGYYRLGIWDDEPADRLQAKYDILDGVVSTTSQVMLGMSLGCARCHDHKKDPLPQRDYYRLLAFFHDIADQNGKNLRTIANDADRQKQASLLQEKQRREGELYSQIYQMEQQFVLAAREKKGIEVNAVPESDLTDLSYKFYRDTWDKLPKFDDLKHEAAGPIASNLISLSPASRMEAIGLVFEGKLKVPQDGDYTFEVKGTEGVRLTVAGQTVVNKPEKGQHLLNSQVPLKQGLWPIRVDYFNTTQKPVLSVSWAGPGVALRSLSQPAQTRDERPLLADARKGTESWFYTTTKPADNWMKPDFKTEGWKQGPGGFGTKGTPGAIVRTEWATDHIWLRKTLSLSALPARLALDVHHDEDIFVYINGKLVFEEKGFLKTYQQVTLGAEAIQALKLGDNVIAVSCRQTGGGQYVDLGLVDLRTDLQGYVRTLGKEIWGEASTQKYWELSAELEKTRKVATPEVGLEVMCVEERGRNVTKVLIRGSAHAPGEEVQPGVPGVLSGVPVDLNSATSGAAGSPTKNIKPVSPGSSSGKRLALANWMTQRDNPLTSRVLANRLWQYHFGRGLVPSSNDFGLLGETCSHPELLDWLAGELMSGAWRLKRMHKLIMLSNTYQMSAVATPEGLKQDAGNQLWWRYNMRRLVAEEVRDTMLAVSGQLNLTAGGPSIYPPIPRAVLAGQSVPGQGWKTSSPEESNRRSVYVHVKRSLLVPILSAHDAADTDSSCPVRYTTTVPTQALGMLNGEFTHEQAAAFAGRLAKEAPGDLKAQITRGIRLTAGRPPRADEVSRDLAFLAKLQKEHELTGEKALAYYCLILLNSNEMMYVD